MSDVLFFKDKNELLKWFKKNHSKEEQWVGLYKKAVPGKPSTLSMGEVTELALCFGWTGVVIKSIDVWTYKISLRRRKKDSVWGNVMIKKFKELEKAGLVHASGKKAFTERSKKKSEESVKAFTPAQLKEFKKNKKAWDYFNTQTHSYRKYMTYWVTSAKREETQVKRLKELISDSAEGTKLKRVLLAQEKAKPRYEEGKTPIEAARNLGMASGLDLRAVNIETLEQLKRTGWERALTRIAEMYPHRLNLNFFYAVVGAVEDQSSRRLDPDLKAQAKDLLQQLRRG